MAQVKGDWGSSGITPLHSTYGVWGDSAHTGVVGTGFQGIEARGRNFGINASGSVTGVMGWGASQTGVVGSSYKGSGIVGVAYETGAAGVEGHGHGGPGVLGLSDEDSAIVGLHGNRDTAAASFSNLIIVGRGRYVAITLGPALQCWGHVDVVGDLTVSGAKQFRIDHPLNPDKQYLSHAAVEAPEMKNLYDGIATIGKNGQAVVELPKWFGALNRTFRYQLTALGAPCPTLFVAAEIQGNKFTIGGGYVGLKVSWQVTGIRNDLWARTHPMAVESPKPKDRRGRSPGLPVPRRRLYPAALKLVAMHKRATEQAKARRRSMVEMRAKMRMNLRAMPGKKPRAGRRREARRKRRV